MKFENLILIFPIKKKGPQEKRCNKEEIKTKDGTENIGIENNK
jgi:hypothetical protein